MATFKVHEEGGADSWMSCIFKVGDDCRQDVLALQLISVFKGIFEACNLDVYLFPYRVVATEPGCGVIQVIPRSISRDMMGREKVNSLYDWFEFEFGGQTTPTFARARHEFIRSLAASSIVMYILQIKDRHNGNIMFDKEGHMVYIDFGFMLSIAPGGGLLEVSPFKLTREMLQVLGGDGSPHFVLFSELLVKCFLAIRPFAPEIIAMVELCMQSGLPCFKGRMGGGRVSPEWGVPGSVLASPHAASHAHTPPPLPTRQERRPSASCASASSWARRTPRRPSS
jgi:phosphatidylinositol 4-kinase